MNLRLIRAAAAAEKSDELHMARLLLLVSRADRGKGKSVEGIMKLAKLDFLLRYPNCLERVLQKTKGDIESASIQSFERETVETKMIRFKYGPWDARYRRWIGLLVAKGLVTTGVIGNTVHVKITDLGKKVAAQLSELDEFRVVDIRCRLILDAVGSLSATRLKEFIYETFPEILDRKWGEEIEI